jgi:antitoxin ParD1/3/4
MWILVWEALMPHRSAAPHEKGRRFEHRESEDELRLAALRDAAKVGIADIENGNFRSFSSAEMCSQYLATLTSEVIGA